MRDRKSKSSLATPWAMLVKLRDVLPMIDPLVARVRSVLKRSETIARTEERCSSNFTSVRAGAETASSSLRKPWGKGRPRMLPVPLEEVPADAPRDLSLGDLVNRQMRQGPGRIDRCAGEVEPDRGPLRSPCLLDVATQGEANIGPAGRVGNAGSWKACPCCSDSHATRALEADRSRRAFAPGSA